MTAPEWAPGHIVGGKYTVRAELGRGTRMRTYAALTEPNREVVLRAVGLENAAELDGVAQRLSALAALPEAYVLRVVDVARDVASGARFVVTDRSRSPSLKTLVELCPLTLDEGIAFASKLGAALDAMHERRVLHLALRPSNVFVGAMPEGAVEIADAGVPRLDESPVERMRWTATEAHDGTNGAAADVFGAALLIFFALTGQSYFAAEGEQELAAEIAGPRVAASKRASELGVTLPASVDAAFERALAADPRSRPRTVGELARMLGASGEDKEKRARPPELVKPPADLMASLIDSELKNVDVPASSAAVPLAGEGIADAEVQPAPEPAAPPLLAAPLFGTPPGLVAPALEAAPLEALPPAPRKRRLGLVLGAAGGVVVLLVVVIAVALGAKKNSASTISAAASGPSSVATEPGSAGPVASVETAPSGSSSATPLDPEHSEILVVCEPTCDLVMVDRKRMTRYPEPLRVAPGQHGVGVSAHDYWGDWKLVETKGGERATVTFKLRPKPDNAPDVVHTAPAATASTKKPCGKFLKRCDD